MLVFFPSSLFTSSTSLRTTTPATPRMAATSHTPYPRDVATLRTPHTHGTPYPIQLNGHHHHILVLRVSHAHPPPPHHFSAPPPPALSRSIRARWAFRIHSGRLLRLHTASYLSVLRTVPSAEASAMECEGGRVWEAREGKGKRRTPPRAHYSAFDAPAVPDPGTTGANDAAEQAAGAAAAIPSTVLLQPLQLPSAPWWSARPALACSPLRAVHQRGTPLALSMQVPNTAHICAVPSAQSLSALFLLAQPPSTPPPSAWCVLAPSASPSPAPRMPALYPPTHVSTAPVSAVPAWFVGTVPAAHVCARPISSDRAARFRAVCAV
ncbi:hypothetical protein PLICRDRAFT_177069 [Plicaturopsis crispa FD-325 SS-3]|nr:hypothetical protein PLICRDRAFT_177069 [Plicaturopsis crispa FD-325 SS-3]